MKKFQLAAFAVAALASLFCIGPVFADDYGRDRDRHGDHDRMRAMIVWKGNVDDTVNVYVRGDRAWERVKAGGQLRDVELRVNQPLPVGDVDVQVTKVRGRGDVYVFQAPSRRNHYTLGFRIEDHDSGADDYRVAINW